MKLKDIIIESTNKLRKLNIEDCSAKIKILIEYFFNISRNQIILKEEKELTESEILGFENLIKKIENGIPVQYITHKQEFMGLNFYVDENVLIPQPDTEILVEEIIKYCNNIENKNIKILDLCTGSGIIAISLGKYLKNVEIYASDLSKKSLEVAKKNANANKVEINFIHSDMFENIDENNFDIIVSNPPYIETNIIKTLSKEVQNEPVIALDGGDDGLKFYKIIAENAMQYINKNGKIFLEIGYNQREKVSNLFKDYCKVTCIKDLASNDRVLVIERK